MAMERTLRIIDQELRAGDLRIALPCDAGGTPVP